MNTTSRVKQRIPSVAAHVPRDAKSRWSESTMDGVIVGVTFFNRTATRGPIDCQSVSDGIIDYVLRCVAREINHTKYRKPDWTQCSHTTGSCITWSIWAAGEQPIRVRRVKVNWKDTSSINITTNQRARVSLVCWSSIPNKAIGFQCKINKNWKNTLWKVSKIWHWYDQ